MQLDFNKILFIDLESRSELDVTEVGAYAYAQHPSTEILCACYAVGVDGPVIGWWPEEDIPFAWIRDAQEQGYIWCAHNHEFEEQMLLNKYGLETGPWIDTATLCSIAGMPRNLEDCAKSLKLEIQKMSKAAMHALSKPRKPSADNPAMFWERPVRPDLFEALIEYCKSDVRLMQLILPKLPPPEVLLPPREAKLGALTDDMNKRGIRVDIVGVAKAQQTVAEHFVIMAEEFGKLVPGIGPRSNVLLAKHFQLPDVAKDTIRDALKHEPEGPRRRALELKQTISMSSHTKLKALIQRVTADKRYHGQMTFHGAGRTGRWSSMGVQLQNLPRGISDGKGGADPVPDEAFDVLHAGVMDLVFDNPTKYIAAMLRGMFIGPLLTGDFSQIEARVLCGLAGQKDVLMQFAQKKDPYKNMAAKIYAKAADIITKSERFMGKQAVLGCGYGLGYGGFIYMLKSIYDIDISPEEAQRVVTVYRQANPHIVNFWWAIERLVKRVVLEHSRSVMTSSAVFDNRIGAKMYKSWLVLKLPSGRCLWYYEPTLEETERGLQLYYWGRNPKKGGKWERVKTYGGKITENVTQALARDIMADAMLRQSDAGFHPLLTVHDEIVSEGEEHQLPDFERLMREPPAWWPDLPLDVEVQHVARYTK